MNPNHAFLHCMLPASWGDHPPSSSAFVPRQISTRSLSRPCTLFQAVSSKQAVLRSSRINAKIQDEDEGDADDDDGLETSMAVDVNDSQSDFDSETDDDGPSSAPMQLDEQQAMNLEEHRLALGFAPGTKHDRKQPDLFPNYQPQRATWDKVTRNVKWWDANMVKALKDVEDMINVRVLIEIRDARIPRVCSHPLFEKWTRVMNLHRILVYSHADLISRADRIKLLDWASGNITDRESIFFCNLTKFRSMPVSEMKPLSSHIYNMMMKHGADISYKSTKKALVCGIPNVGKSSLIYLLCKELTKKMKKKKLFHAPKVANRAGETKNIKAHWFHEKPAMMLVDTPGLFLPSREIDKDIETYYKLGITGKINPADLKDPIEALEYLLYRLNKARLFQYVSLLNMPGPTEDVNELISYTDHPPGLGAVQHMIRKFLLGELGSLVLDDLEAPIKPFELQDAERSIYDDYQKPRGRYERFDQDESRESQEMRENMLDLFDPKTSTEEILDELNEIDQDLFFRVRNDRKKRQDMRSPESSSPQRNFSRNMDDPYEDNTRRYQSDRSPNQSGTNRRDGLGYWNGPQSSARSSPSSSSGRLDRNPGNGNESEWRRDAFASSPQSHDRENGSHGSRPEQPPLFHRERMLDSGEKSPANARRNEDRLSKQSEALESPLRKDAFYGGFDKEGKESKQEKQDFFYDDAEPLILNPTALKKTAGGQRMQSGPSKPAHLVETRGVTPTDTASSVDWTPEESVVDIVTKTMNRPKTTSRERK